MTATILPPYFTSHIFVDPGKPWNGLPSQVEASNLEQGFLPEREIPAEHLNHAVGALYDVARSSARGSCQRLPPKTASFSAVGLASYTGAGRMFSVPVQIASDSAAGVETYPRAKSLTEQEILLVPSLSAWTSQTEAHCAISPFFTNYFYAALRFGSTNNLILCSKTGVVSYVTVSDYASLNGVGICAASHPATNGKMYLVGGINGTVWRRNLTDGSTATAACPSFICPSGKSQRGIAIEGDEAFFVSYGISITDGHYFLPLAGVDMITGAASGHLNIFDLGTEAVADADVVLSQDTFEGVERFRAAIRTWPGGAATSWTIQHFSTYGNLSSAWQKVCALRYSAPPVDAASGGVGAGAHVPYDAIDSICFNDFALTVWHRATGSFHQYHIVRTELNGTSTRDQTIAIFYTGATNGWGWSFTRTGERSCSLNRFTPNTTNMDVTRWEFTF